MLKPKTKLSITTIRLALKEKGYDVIPLYDGKQPFKSWPTQANDETAIRSWAGRSAGVRIIGDLFVIDIDAKNDAVRDAILAALEARWPDFMRTCVSRHSGRSSVALFGRMKGATVARLQSHRWGATADEKPAHMVEAFSGVPTRKGTPGRFFAVWGPHSEGRVYDYYSAPLHETPIDSLPWFPAAEMGELIDLADTVMITMGLVMQLGSGPAAGGSDPIYDLEPEQVFTLTDGETLTLAELEDRANAHQGDRLTGYATLWDPKSKTANRVLVNLSRDGLSLWDTKEEKPHRWASRKPPPQLHEDPVAIEALRALKAQQTAAADPGRGEMLAALPRPAHAAPIEDKAAWLVRHYGWSAYDKAVVELFAPSDRCMMMLDAFRVDNAAWFAPVVGPQGGEKKPITAFGIWSVHPERPRIAAIHMRPDRPFPLYEEEGLTFKNTYLRPRHVGEGDVLPFLTFMARLVPDEREREWLLSWMAHKQRWPEVRGSGILFMAVDAHGEGVFGTGRGLLFRIAHALYGERYAGAEAFKTLDGSSGQSQFTGWMRNKVLVTVDESQTSPTAHRRGERNAAYEVLKDLVDPAAKKTTFKIKKGVDIEGQSYCSVWMASNHDNALAIPANDRRFTILRNAQTPLPVEAAEAIVAWTETPGSIAALARWLDARDLTGFRMHEPLDTDAKEEMAGRGMSDVEEVMRDMRDDPDRGLVFIRIHMEQSVCLALGLHGGLAQKAGEFEGAWSRMCRPVRAAGGGPRRVHYMKTRRRLYCFAGDRDAATALPEAALMRQAARWGALDASRTLSEVPASDPGPDKKDE